MQYLHKLLKIKQTHKAEKRLAADVVIIGGGVTGVAMARDAAMRGFKAVILERGAIGCGTSGNFHGVLWSGSRYAVGDSATAAECMRESAVIKRIAQSAVLQTGGLFVALSNDDLDYAARFIPACKRAGIPVSDADVADILNRMPHLSTSVKRALAVPDAYVDGVKMLRLTRRAAETQDLPAEFLTHTSVTGFNMERGRIAAVRARDGHTGQLVTIDCGFVINAAGVWAGHVSKLAGITIEMVANKGSMIVFEKQFCPVMLHRCRPEADGDILVATGSHSILGTTAANVANVANPDNLTVTQEEINHLVKEGSAMVPGLDGARMRKIYAGVRPLFSAGSKTKATLNGRHISRSFKILDHQYGGVSNFISIVGGKFTLHRLMAEQALDLMCAKTGASRSCRTDIENLLSRTPALSHKNIAYR